MGHASTPELRAAARRRAGECARGAGARVSEPSAGAVGCSTPDPRGLYGQPGLGGLAVRPLADLQIHRRIWATTVAGRRWPPAAAMVELLGSAAAAWREDRAA
jgi:hypothetical protein